MARSFDFASDDVLCAYEDYAAQEKSNGKRFDSAEKNFHDYETNGVRPLVNVYSEGDIPKEDMFSAVEKCMKKYADNLLCYLEGISGRLSQLEVHCYQIERSVTELKSDISSEHGEADGKLKSLEKHIQEVHRCVQILRDKQELVETQMELSKLQVISKESTDSSQSKLSERSVTPSTTEHQKPDDAPEAPSYHLALALPHQIPAQQHALPASLSVQQDRYNVSQAGAYYPQQFKHPYVHTMPNSQELSSQTPLPQSQSRLQAMSQHTALQSQSQALLPQSQSQLQATSHYPAPQWPQQAPQQGPQPPSLQAQMRSQTSPSYCSYPSNHPTNPTPQVYQSNATIQARYSSMPSPGGAFTSAALLSNNGPAGPVPQPVPQEQHSEAVAVNYGVPGSSVLQQLPQPHILQQFPAQTNQSSFASNTNKSSYLANVVYTPVIPNPGAQGYTAAYNFDGGGAAHPQIPTDIVGLKTQQVVLQHPVPQLIHIHPYTGLIEKAINMGYSKDHVLSVILRMAESNQQVDFNALLDMLNSRSSGASPRAWGV